MRVNGRILLVAGVLRISQEKCLLASDCLLIGVVENLPFCFFEYLAVCLQKCQAPEGSHSCSAHQVVCVLHFCGLS